MPRSTKDPQERREEILDAAQNLFQTKGYQQTAVSDIVKKIGVAQGTFYYYFKSKEEVAEAIIDRHLAQIMEPFTQISSSTNLRGYHKLAALLVKELDDLHDHDDMFNYLHHEQNAYLHQKLIVRMIHQFSPVIADIIEQGKKEGDFIIDQPAQLIAEFLLTGLQFWLDSFVFQWSKEEREARIQQIGGIIEKVLGTKKGAFDFTHLKNVLAEQ